MLKITFLNLKSKLIIAIIVVVVIVVASLKAYIFLFKKFFNFLNFYER